MASKAMARNNVVPIPVILSGPSAMIKKKKEKQFTSIAIELIALSLNYFLDSQLGPRLPLQHR